MILTNVQKMGVLHRLSKLQLYRVKGIIRLNAQSGVLYCEDKKIMDEEKMRGKQTRKLPTEIFLSVMKNLCVDQEKVEQSGVDRCVGICRCAAFLLMTDRNFHFLHFEMFYKKKMNADKIIQQNTLNETTLFIYFIHQSRKSPLHVMTGHLLKRIRLVEVNTLFHTVSYLLFHTSCATVHNDTLQYKLK